MSKTEITIATLSMLPAAEIFKSGGMRSILDAIKSEASSEVGSVESVQGRKDIASMAHKVSKSKSLLDKLGKALADDLNSQLKPINAERKLARDELDDLRDTIRQPLSDWEDEEKARVAAIALKAEIDDCLEVAHLLNDKFDRDEEERRAAIKLLEKQKEEEAAKEKADMLAKAKEDAEAKAQEEAKSELDRLERELNEDIARRDREAIEAAAAAQAEIDRVENARLEEIARRDRAEIEAAEAARREIELLEREKAAEIQRREQAVSMAKADAARLIAEAQDKKDQAEKELLAREANKRHVRAINNKALQALVSNCGIRKDVAKNIVTEIARNHIPKVKISY